MKLTFEGAAKTVTGSKFLLEVNNSRLLIDCGLFQGKRADTYDRNLNFNFDPKTIDAVLLTHAHIDHSGNLPNLVKQVQRTNLHHPTHRYTGQNHAAGFRSYPRSGY